MNHNGGGFAAADLPGERRAGYGAAPPASRVATAIAARRVRARLDPGASTAPHRAVAGGRGKALPAGPRGAHDQAQQNKVSTVSGDCHYLNGYVPTLQTGGAVVSFLTAHLDDDFRSDWNAKSSAVGQRGQAVPQPGLGSRI